jgi:hypothetical protein
MAGGHQGGSGQRDGTETQLSSLAPSAAGAGASFIWWLLWLKRMAFFRASFRMLMKATLA